MASAIANVLVGAAEVRIDDNPVGWTTDGATLTVSSEFSDVRVHELVGTVKRILVDQTVTVTLTMAEGTLANLEEAIPGSSLALAVLTIGGGALQEVEIKVIGKNPAGFARTIVLAKCNPTGEVGIVYKKGDISIVPVTFTALISAAGIFGTLTDAAA